ncbi:DDE family transposase [Rhodococcus sp. OK302]|nr:DDE family transposase [Rhodococcus sp. OK302]
MDWGEWNFDLVSKSTSSYPKLSVDITGSALVSHGGAVTLIRTAEKTGLTAALSEALSPWRKPTAHHDPGKIILDLALSPAVGGDCLADIATLREQPAVFGPVASDATVSRLITRLAADGPAALSAINSARAAARKAAWSHAGIHAPDHHIDAQGPLMSTSTPPSSPPIQRRNALHRTSSGATVSIQCWRS